MQAVLATHVQLGQAIGVPLVVHPCNSLHIISAMLVVHPRNTCSPKVPREDHHLNTFLQVFIRLLMHSMFIFYQCNALFDIFYQCDFQV